MHVILRGEAPSRNGIAAGAEEAPQLGRQPSVVGDVPALHFIADQLGNHAVIAGTGALRDARVGRIVGGATIIGRGRRKSGHHRVKRRPRLRRRGRAG